MRKATVWFFCFYFFNETLFYFKEWLGDIMVLKSGYFLKIHFLKNEWSEIVTSRKVTDNVCC